MKHITKIVIIIIIFFVYLYIKRTPPQLFFTTGDFPQVRDVENNWQMLASEIPPFDPNDPNMMTRDRYAWNNDKADVLLNKLKNNKTWVKGWLKDTEWYQFPLMYHGKVIGEAEKICPNTIKLLKQHPEIQIVGFALLRPNTRMPVHDDGTGVFSGSMACNLALQIEDASLYVAKNKDVKNTKKLKDDEWSMCEYSHKLGKMVIFDSERKHYADNKNFKKNRVILYMDIKTKQESHQKPLPQNSSHQKPLYKKIIGVRQKGVGLASKMGFPTINMIVKSHNIACGFYSAETNYGKITIISRCDDVIECNFLQFSKYSDQINNSKTFAIWDIKKIKHDDSSIIKTYNDGCTLCK